MKKSLFIFPTILIIVLLILFFVFISKEYKESEYGAVVIEPGENYIIKEVNGETIVENENVGLTFKVPQGWDVEKKELGEGEWIVNLMSPDAEINETGLLIDGCGVSVGVKEDKIQTKILAQSINDLSDDSSIINIIDKQGLKYSQETPSGLIKGVQVPFLDKIYGIETLILNNHDHCISKFEEIVNDLIISW